MKDANKPEESNKLILILHLKILQC